MSEIKEDLQQSLYDMGDDYQIKTDEELLDIISQFGIGETEFHTVDIERLIKEKQALISFVNRLGIKIEDIL